MVIQVHIYILTECPPTQDFFNSCSKVSCKSLRRTVRMNGYRNTFSTYIIHSICPILLLLIPIREEKMLTKCKLSMLLYNNHNTLVYVTLSLMKREKIHTSSKWKKNEEGNNNKQQLYLVHT